MATAVHKTSAHSPRSSSYSATSPSSSASSSSAAGQSGRRGDGWPCLWVLTQATHGRCRGRAGAPRLQRSRTGPLVAASATVSDNNGPAVFCTYYAAASHFKPGHPEAPSRVEAVVERLRSHPWPQPGEGPPPPRYLPGSLPYRTSRPLPSLPSSSSLPSSPSPRRVRLHESRRMASPEELALVHPPAYVEAIRAACGKLREAVLVDDSTYLAPGSYDECSRSVGAVLDAIDVLLYPLSRGIAEANTVAALAAAATDLEPLATAAAARPCNGPGDYSGVGDSGGSGGDETTMSYAAAFALVRPPGHHVLPNRPMGFGIFNTISIAARYARQQYDVEKIAILDFDVHHGNGTAEIFDDDPYTLYVSIHQAGLWPYTGKAREAGTGAGRGATINVPLPGGYGDRSMREAWSRVVLPTLESFRPQLLLASAGYDGHWRDPLAGGQLTPSTYHWLCGELLALSRRHCARRLALILEGGYDIPSLSESVVASLEGLLGAPATSIQPPAARELYDEPLGRLAGALQEVCRVHGL